jgi:RNA recognition motif-containing protein
MGSKLYVGNLSYSITSSDLQTMFEKHGSVSSAEVINDRESGRSKGFGFVQMGSDDEAQAAISALSGQESDGRALTVNEAKPREDRPRSGGSSRGASGSYGGGYNSAGSSGGTGYVAREKGNGGKGRDSDSRRY